VDFELSEDQAALRSAARELLEVLASREAVRAVVDAGGGYDRGLWKALSDQGWIGVEAPERFGGLGLSMVEVAVLAEELGRRVAPVPVLPSLLAASVLWRAAEEGVAAAEAELGPVLSGERIGAVALDPGAPVVGAPSADVLVARVEQDGEEALVLVDLERAGRPPREPAMDLTQELGFVELSGVPVTRIGGATAARELLERGAVAYAAELLGAGERVLEMAVAYAKDRVQFGRPIGSFQAVKHRLADALVDVEGMRSAVYWAAWCLASGDAERSLAASTAKAWCSDAARRVAASGLQVHGGIGFTWEHDLHLYLKRVELDGWSFGDAAFHRARLAALLRARVEAGEGVV
jgi:alkylation response protein AidB-like acyl-CoA dehydrogenase